MAWMYWDVRSGSWIPGSSDLAMPQEFEQISELEISKIPHFPDFFLFRVIDSFSAAAAAAAEVA